MLEPRLPHARQITNVQRDDVLSTAYKIALDRKVGQISINGGTFIVAAGNTPEDSAIARPLPAPLLNRFRVIRVDPPSLKDWVDYMDRKYNDAWDKRVYAFLAAYEGENYLVQKPDDAETLEQFATPRTWTILAARSLDLEKDAPTLVGRELGLKFRTFLRARVDVNEIIRNPDRYDGLTLDQKYMLTIQLANVKDIKKILPVAVKILKDRGELFIVFARALPKASRRKVLKAVKDAAPDAFESIAEAASVVA